MLWVLSLTAPGCTYFSPEFYTDLPVVPQVGVHPCFPHQKRSEQVCKRVLCWHVCGRGVPKQKGVQNLS